MLDSRSSTHLFCKLRSQEAALMRALCQSLSGLSVQDAKREESLQRGRSRVALLLPEDTPPQLCPTLLSRNDVTIETPAGCKFA